MLQADWADRARAPRGKILVEREEMPTMAGKLWLPPGYRKHTLSSTAVVVDVGQWNFLDRQMIPGVRVVLSAAAGKPITFGARDERTLWCVSPDQIMLILTEEAQTAIDSNPVRSMTPEILEGDTSDKFEEGDPRGLR